MKHIYKIKIENSRQMVDFVGSVVKLPTTVRLSNSSNQSANAKSMLGVIMAMHWDPLFCTADIDIYDQISKFCV